MQSRLVPKYRQRTRTVTCAAEEAYLRDDVPCGHAGCGHCRPPPVGGCLAADAPALLMPDADTLRFYLEVGLTGGDQIYSRVARPDLSDTVICADGL